MSLGLGVGSREWVLTFWVLVVIAVLGLGGLRWQSVAAVLLLGGLTGFAHLRLADSRVPLMRGLRWVASSNPTGEVWLGMLFVLPKLLVANGYACLLALLSVALPRAFIEKAWLTTVRRLGPQRSMPPGSPRER